jgi:small subunit ribosomal protein S4e
MARGPKKHMKRLNAPRHWMLDKLSGVFAPKPTSGPHKQRECLPLMLVLRNRLKYALTGGEVNAICMQRLIKVDSKIRTNKNYPTGFMDVITVDKTDEHFRVIYDHKGRFVMHRISKEEAAYKVCRVKDLSFGPKGIPQITTHDGRTIRYPDPLVRMLDSVVVDTATNKIKDFIKFDIGNLVMVTGGRNTGRVGVVQHREKHKGTFDICHVKDAAGNEFATRMSNVFVIGKGSKPMVSLPKAKGIKMTIVEEMNKRKEDSA